MIQRLLDSLPFSDQDPVERQRRDILAAFETARKIDPERLAQALADYVDGAGFLDLGAVDRAFMPQRFREVADALADLYERTGDTE